MMDVADLRSEVRALNRRHRSSGYPAALRGRLVAAAERLRAEGLSWKMTGKALGVGTSTLQTWCRRQGVSHEDVGVALIPVELVCETSPGVPPQRTVALTSPSGWHVEGLMVSEVQVLLEALA